jgi:hypothetical protein
MWTGLIWLRTVTFVNRVISLRVSYNAGNMFTICLLFTWDSVAWDYHPSGW